MKSGRISPWYFEFVAPLIDAYYAGDLDLARGLHAVALASLSQEPDHDFARAKWLRLQNAWIFILLELGQVDEGMHVFDELLANWGINQPGPESAEMARVCELLTRLHMDLGGWLPLHPQEVQQLINAVPEHRRGGNFWNEVGLWAFRHRNRKLLDEALIHFSGDPAGDHKDWFHWRLVLMRRMLTHSAKVADVRHVIGLIEERPQMREFKRYLLPACAAEGLVTPEIEVELEDKASKLAA